MDSDSRHLLRFLHCLIAAGQLVVMLFLASQHTTAGWAAFYFVLPFLVINIYNIIWSFVSRDNKRDEDI